MSVLSRSSSRSSMTPQTAAGLTKENVVQCRIYLTDIENWDRVNAVYGAFFGAHKPARVVVPVPALHFGCLTEIEAVAELPEES